MTLDLTIDTATLRYRIDQIDHLLENGSKTDARRMLKRFKAELPEIVSNAIKAVPRD